MKVVSLLNAVALSLTASVLAAFAGPVTVTNVTTARSNVATSGDAAGVAPACPIPLERGATWTYRGLVLWYSNEAIQSQEMTWVTTVVATYDGPAARAAVIKGFPNELAWYEPGQSPQHSVLVAAGSNVYHINRVYRTNNCEKLTREECLMLAQRLAQSPTAIPAEYQDKLPLLVLPLAVGAKWNDDKWRGDNWYCWYVQGARTTQVAQLAGRTAVVYEVIYLTNPDHSIMQIVPGLGITRYVYEHHGTPAAADMQLVSFHTQNEQSVESVPGREAVGASMLAPQNAIVRTRQVEFTWPRVEGVHSYLLQVRINPDLNEDNLNNIVNEALFGYEHTQRIDLAAIQSSAAGKTLYWGIHARFDDDRTSADWMGPVSFTYQPRNVPVEASEVRVSIGYDSAGAVADGQSALRVTAVVTDRQGRPVVDEQVRFVEECYWETEDGRILGSGDKWPSGCSCRDAGGGGFLQDEEHRTSNLYTTRTDANGMAHARYKMPAWRPFMRTKPMALGVWYHGGGGGENPYVRTNLWPAQPPRRGAAFAPSWTGTNDPMTLPAVYPYHIVQRGDTLWSITRKYGCRISELAATNALGPSAVLRVGQKLIVPVNQTIIASGDVQQDITVTTNNMVLIPAGALTMGNCMDPGEGVEHELPVHTVMISAFYMDKTEVAKATWDEVYTWATNHRYSIDSGVNVAANHPARMVSWYDCVKWCNARSEKEGRTPCYTVGGNVYKSGKCAPDCNWSANGYRLPTEAEWEKAARGGLNGRRFPWNDLNITHTNACYDSSPCYAYDTSVTRRFHPAFNGTYPYTIPVGYFANGYGVYDMAGNVQEWCWDWYDDTYYANSPGSDPRGPASGTYRVLRGGGSGDLALFCRVAYRSGALPDYTEHVGFGFRCVRGL